MARKAHVIGYRLGESRWWQSRTPPVEEKGEREEVERGKTEIVTGVMEKMGILMSEMQIEEGKRERIKIIGSRGMGSRARPLGSKERYKAWKNSGLEVYIVSYLREIVREYYKKTSEISFRQLKNYYNDGKMLAQAIAKSYRGLYPTMRGVKRRVQREAIRKNRIARMARPRYKRYVKEIVMQKKRQWALERAQKAKQRANQKKWTKGK